MTVPTPSSHNPEPSESSGADGRGAGGQDGPSDPRASGPGWGTGGPAPWGEAPHGWGKAGPAAPPAADGRELLRREAREGGLCALAVTVLGLLLGPLWFWAAPRTPMLTDGQGVYLKHPEGEEAIGADGSFLMLSLALGAVAGVLVFLVRRRGGVGLVAGLLVGGLLAAVVGWRFGVWLGPETDLVTAAQKAGKGGTFDGPLKLQAKGALLALPFGALLVHLGITAVFGERDPLPGVEGTEGAAPGEAGMPGTSGAPEEKQGPSAGWGPWPGPEAGRDNGGGPPPDQPGGGAGGPAAPPGR